MTLLLTYLIEGSIEQAAVSRQSAYSEDIILGKLCLENIVVQD